MKARFIQAIGSIAYLRIYWEDAVKCPGMGYHNAMREIARSAIPHDQEVGGSAKDYPDAAQWPTQCSDCGQLAPESAHSKRQVHHKTFYNTPDGKKHPGDIYFEDLFGDECRAGECHSGWSNCDGRHLNAVLPNGQHWDMDSRATNCTLPNDTVHRCWVRHGDPVTGLIHVDKQGLTCSAGAGSIAAPGWHGFLHQGEFVP